MPSRKVAFGGSGAPSMRQAVEELLVGREGREQRRGDRRGDDDDDDEQSEQGQRPADQPRHDAAATPRRTGRGHMAEGATSATQISRDQGSALPPVERAGNESLMLKIAIRRVTDKRSN